MTKIGDSYTIKSGNNEFVIKIVGKTRSPGIYRIKTMFPNGVQPYDSFHEEQLMHLALISKTEVEKIKKIFLLRLKEQKDQNSPDLRRDIKEIKNF